jgi:hypothetical protein
MRTFLFRYCADMDGMAGVEAEIERMAKINTVTLLRGLDGIEGVLVDPPAEAGALRRLVV